MFTLLSTFLAGLIATAFGATILEFADKPVNSALRAGAVRVEVRYEPIRGRTEADLERKNLSYQIFYNNRLALRDQANTLVFGRLRLLDLDRDGNAEVITETFSGGAHCCTTTLIYTWRGGRFRKLDFGPVQGAGLGFEDLDGDGTVELISRDQSFYYAFSSYAGSRPPSMIFSLRNGQLVDTTRNYTRFLRSELNQMFRALEEVRAQGITEINGILAGYVAQKALLGEFESGWRFMLERYDRTSEDGLDIYDNAGKRIGRYRDFPTALRAHLRRRGYIR